MQIYRLFCSHDALCLYSERRRLLISLFSMVSFAFFFIIISNIDLQNCLFCIWLWNRSTNLGVVVVCVMVMTVNHRRKFAAIGMRLIWYWPACCDIKGCC
jgi:hypothetical protein